MSIGPFLLNTRVKHAQILRTLVFSCVALGVALLYILSKASANTELFSKNYPSLLGLGLSLALGLMLLILYELWILKRKLAAKLFGSKLTLRLTTVFVLMALVPGALLYTVSVQFLAKSIESWFDVRVDTALERGIQLGRSAMETSLKGLLQKADSMATELTGRSSGSDVAFLNRLRDQYGIEEATLVSSRGDLIAFSSAEKTRLLPALPGAKILREQERDVLMLHSQGDLRRDEGLLPVAHGRSRIAVDPHAGQRISAISSPIGATTDRTCQRTGVPAEAVEMLYGTAEPVMSGPRPRGRPRN